MYVLLLGCACKASALVGECMGGGGCDVMVYVCMRRFSSVHARHQLWWVSAWVEVDAWGAHHVMVYACAAFRVCVRKASALVGECMGGGGCDVMVYVCMRRFSSVYARHQLWWVSAWVEVDAMGSTPCHGVCMRRFSSVHARHQLWWVSAWVEVNAMGAHHVMVYACAAFRVCTQGISFGG